MCCGLARWHFVLFGGRGVDGDTLAHRMVQPMPLGNSEQAGSTPARPPFPAARYTGFMQSLPVQSLDGRVAGRSCYETYAVGQRC